jgi:uncharacterized membrane protein
MGQWYCHIGPQRYGPVSEEELRSWIAQGRVQPGDPVWTEGMANWAPAGQVFGLGALPPAGGPPPISLVATPPPGGTGGRTPNAELTAQARACLRGRWGIALAFCLVAHLLSQGLNTIGSVASSAERVQRLRHRQPRGPERGLFDAPERWRSGPEAPGVVSAVGTIGGMASLILGGPFALSLAIFFLTLTRGGNAGMELLFAGFRNFGNALAAYILIGIFVFLWALLLIIPGIIAALAYSQTYYLLAEDKGLGPLEAMRKSKEMMRGHKGRLFCLGLGFIGWILLCLLTCGIGFLWLGPYMATSFARFYDDLRPAGAFASAAPAPSPA